MLQKIKLHNFKSHLDTELNLDGSRLHALVGQNSSGKTSILQALYYLGQLLKSQFKDIFREQAAPEFIMTMGERKVSVSGSGLFGYQNKKIWQASYQFERDPIKSWNPTGSWAISNTKEEITDWHSSLSESLTHLPPKEILQFVYLKLVASNLAQAAYSDAVAPQMAFDGSGLAPTLDYLRNEAPDRFSYLQRMLQQVVPGVQKVSIRRAEVMVNRQRLIEVDGKSISYEESQKMAGQEVVFDMNTGGRIPAHAVSEGTMLALGLLTVLMNPKPPNLVLLDDIEQGLHPKAQRELVVVLKEIIKTSPNLQIIFTTHSPYIVDELTPSQVHVLSNATTGFTHARRLDEHPDIAWAEQTLTTGEFWDAEGEAWVLAGQTDGDLVGVVDA